MSGVYVQDANWFSASTEGICSVNGVHSDTTIGITELGVLAPTGTTTTEVAGVITLWG